MSNPHQLGDGPIQDAYRQKMTDLARSLDKGLMATSAALIARSASCCWSSGLVIPVLRSAVTLSRTVPIAVTS